jgi:hypothetical protein
MTTQTRFSTTPASRLRRAGVGLALLVAALALPVGGCHLLDVATPDIVPIGNLNSPTALPTIRAGVIGDLGLAYDGSGAQGSSGTTEGLVQLGGMLGDELINTETFPDRVQADARQIDVNSGTMATVFANLARARAAAEGAISRFRALSDTTTNSGLSEMLSLSGYSFLLAAENYCNGVPVDQLQPDGSIVFGVQLTTAQLLDTAQNRFTQAAAAAGALPAGATKTSMVALANLGIARALLDKGDFNGADAAASAANVPTTFNYLFQHDLNSFRQQNGIFNALRNFKRYGVPDSSEGGVGINWRGVVGGVATPDPRTPIFRAPGTNLGFDKKTPQYDQLRYVDQKQPTPMASGAEARLINAEAALQRGDTVGFMGFLNGLRAAPPAYIQGGSAATPTVPAPIPAMAALATPTSPAAAVNLLFSERGRWLWLTAHRLNDMRRLVRATGVRGGYGRAVNTVFPNGPYFKNGLTYGSDVNLPVPITEQNNPNFVQCLDRNP